MHISCNLASGLPIGIEIYSPSNLSMSTRTKEISAATVYIERRLNQPLSIAQIATEVGLSSFHFQRLFLVTLGESVSEYIRSRRLELAAKLLTDNHRLSIIEIALECGFESHSAFSRAFRTQFGRSPTDFRTNLSEYSPQAMLDNRPYLRPIRDKHLNIPADLVELPALWLQYREQRGVVNGAYFPDIEPLQVEFAALATNSDSALWATCGAYRGGPSAFSDDSAVGCYGGLFNQEPSLTWSEHCEALPPGLWAVFSHYGDFDFLYMTWNLAVRSWLPSSVFELRDSWAFETYLAQPGKMDPEVPSAQIYLPIKEVK